MAVSTIRQGLRQQGEVSDLNVNTFGFAVLTAHRETTANFPPSNIFAQSSGACLHIASSRNGDYALQIFIPNGGTGILAIRQCSGGSWGSWRASALP